MPLEAKDVSQRGPSSEHGSSLSVTLTPRSFGLLRPFVGQNLIFSGAKNRICVVLASFVAHSKPISVGNSSGI